MHVSTRKDDTIQPTWQTKQSLLFQHMHIRSASFVSPKADERPDDTGWGSQNCTATGNLDKARRSGGNWRISRVMTARAIGNRRQVRFRRNEVA